MGSANNSGSGAFPVGGGELGRLIREFDWSRTSIGPIAGWPQSMRTAIDIALQAPLPVVQLWGPEGILIYNDAYAAFAADRHPGILGAKVLEAWPEAADLNRTVLDECLHAGRTLTYKDLPLTLYRLKGQPDQLWVDLSYSPILGENGQPAGVIALVIETTRRFLAERTLAEERAAVIEANRRLSAESSFLRDLFEQTPSFMALLTGPAHVFALTNESYRQLIDQRDVIGKPMREALPEVVEQGFADILDRVYRTGEPFIGSGSRVTLQARHDPEPREHFLDFIYQPLRNAAGEITGIFVEGQDVTKRLRGEQHLQLLVNELNHRVKNTLAIVQSVAAQTFRTADNLPQAQQAFAARIMALARANDLLTVRNWEGASFADVVDTAARTLAGGDASRMRASGPLVRLSPKTALSVSMALHELATNALKYGALSNDTGHVDVSWSQVPDGASNSLHFEWREIGGPAVSPPQRRGFGSRLIERGLAAELGGQVKLNFDPSGLVCVIDAPLDLYAGDAP